MPTPKSSPRKAGRKIKCFAVVNKDFKFEEEWPGMYIVELFPNELTANWHIEERQTNELKVIPVKIIPYLK